MTHDLTTIKVPRTSSPSRDAFRVFAHALGAIVAIWAGALQAADTHAYERALASGKSKLEAGQVDAAARDFQQAVQADGSQYEGFFYLAVASFRSGNHAAALEYGNAAVAAAKGQDKSRAEELLAAILKAKETEELAHQGDEAQGRGLIAKAADLYARAFQLSPDRGDLGLKAATLYANRLNRLFEAAVLYQDVIAAGEASAANTAGAELGALHEPLQQLYREELPRAVASGDLRNLEKLSKAFPHQSQPRLEVAALQAAKGDDAAVAHWLGEAVKLGTGYDDVKAKAVFLDLWAKDAAAFKSFINDAFGAPAVADMDQRLKDRLAKQAEERRLVAEKARAEQAAREKRLRDEQAAREQVVREELSRPLRVQLRKPVVAELDRLLQAGPVKRIGFRGPAKFFGGYDKSFDELHVSLELQGNGYVLTHTCVSEHWRRPGTKEYEKRAYTIESFSPMTKAAVDPVYAAADLHEIRNRIYGPAEEFSAINVTFSGLATSLVSHDSRSSDSPKTERTNSVYGTFIVKDVADRARIASLFWELKAIDSFTLEQLRERAGGG
jgi:hypothetical protein